MFILLALLAGIMILEQYERSLNQKLETLHYTNDSLDAVLNTLYAQQKIKEGDLIFQTSLSGQSEAIQLATKSKYSHCGLIYEDSTGFYVLEAVEPVKFTPLEQWINQGQDGKYVIKRLKNADQVLTPAVLQKMKNVGKQFHNKKYDIAFGWSDDKMYCSELVWKIYQRGAGIEIGALQKMGDFDLTSKVVQEKLKARYGSTIPVNEKVISPAAIFDSELLVTIKSNE